MSGDQSTQEHTRFLNCLGHRSVIPYICFFLYCSSKILELGTRSLMKFKCVWELPQEGLSYTRVVQAGGRLCSRES
jgi:hypothetical protein